MAERKHDWPDAGDLVIAAIEEVTDYGAYVLSGTTKSDWQVSFRRAK